MPSFIAVAQFLLSQPMNFSAHPRPVRNSPLETRSMKTTFATFNRGQTEELTLKQSPLTCNERDKMEYTYENIHAVKQFRTRHHSEDWSKNALNSTETR